VEGCLDVEYARFEAGQWRKIQGAVIREGAVRLHVNGLELVTLMCTPRELDYLALGFLRSEGIIESLSDVRLLKVCPSETCVDVWLRQASFELPARRTITSGCAGGVTFADLTVTAQPVESSMVVTIEEICTLMSALGAAAELYQKSRGVHAAAIARAGKLLAVTEDVGRHNTLDKLLGRCLAQGIATEGGILLSTGRISSEMLYKAARMGTPVVASRTSPTHLSIALATAWNLTLVGYVRRDSLNVYAGRQRLVVSEEEDGSHAHA
jgi:FdhD protein